MASDSDSESAAMAAAMGFSSFGHKPAAKKRKFNPTTDAFVEGQALEKLDRGGKKGTGSGGNMIPLGKTRVIGRKEERRVQNEEEIALDGEGGGNAQESEDEGPQYIDTSRTPPALEAEDDDDGPRYIDTSEPAPVAQHEVSNPAYVEAAPGIPDAEAEEMQRRIDAILHSIGSAPPPPSNDPNISPPGKSSYTAPNMLSPPPPPVTDLPNRNGGPPASISAFGADDTFSDTSFMQGGSRGGNSRGARSEAGSEWGGSSRGGGGGSRGGRGGRGERNEKWWVGYYDAAFNANPWESLEREKGLSSVGTWLELPKGQGRGGHRA